MKRKFTLVMSLAVLLFFPVIVRAQEVVAETEATEEQTVSEEGLPNPDSPFFGLQNAIMRLTQNTQLFLTVSEERKAELEERFAKREQVLMEKIESSSNPERLANALTKMKERQSKRLQSLQTRVEKITQKRSEVGVRLQGNLERLKVRQASIEAKKRRVEEREGARAGEIKERLEKRGERLEERGERMEKKIEVRNDKRQEILETREEKINSRGEGAVQGVASSFWDFTKAVLGL